MKFPAFYGTRRFITTFTSVYSINIWISTQPRISKNKFSFMLGHFLHKNFPPFFSFPNILTAVGWGTALQAERFRVRFPMGSLEFLIDSLLPAALWPRVDSACKRNEYQGYLVGGKGGRCVRLTLSPSWADCLEILAASTPWSPTGLSRHVQRLLSPPNIRIILLSTILSQFLLISKHPLSVTLLHFSFLIQRSTHAFLLTSPMF